MYVLRKDYVWKWTHTEEELFKVVKEVFLNQIILKHPNPNMPYYLQTDSSKVGVAGCLYQVDNDGNDRVIGFCSKALSLPEQRWTVSEQELWAIIYGLKKFETYLRGSRVVIRTDHKSLSFINNWNLYSARVTRWILYLQQFNYVVEYIKGKENVVPDILSRYACGLGVVQEVRQICPEIAMFTTNEAKEITTKIKNLAQLQMGDDSIARIIQILKDGNVSEVSHRGGVYRLKEGVLSYEYKHSGKEVLVIPKQMVKDVIKAIHAEAGHFGPARITRLIGDRFFISGLSKTVKETLRSCELCQKTKHSNVKTVGPCQPVITDDVGDLVMVDWYGPLPQGRLGNRYIFVVQDAFSKYVQLYPTKRATAVAAITCVQKWCRKFPMKTILSDNGRQFTSISWYNKLNTLGIRITHTTVRNPRPNSTERVNKELGRLFRAFCHKSHKGWVTVLGKIVDCYNNTIHASTGYTLSEIMDGKKPKLSIDRVLTTHTNIISHSVKDVKARARENIRKSAAARVKHYNKAHRIDYYQIGDVVKIRRENQSNLEKGVCKKFSLLYEGPYKVAAIPYANAYLLVGTNDGKVRGTYNGIHLGRYYEPQSV